MIELKRKIFIIGLLEVGKCLWRSIMTYVIIVSAFILCYTPIDHLTLLEKVIEPQNKKILLETLDRDSAPRLSLYSQI